MNVTCRRLLLFVLIPLASSTAYAQRVTTELRVPERGLNISGATLRKGESVHLFAPTETVRCPPANRKGGMGWVYIDKTKSIHLPGEILKTNEIRGLMNPNRIFRDFECRFEILDSTMVNTAFTFGAGRANGGRIQLWLDPARFAFLNAVKPRKVGPFTPGTDKLARADEARNKGGWNTVFIRRVGDTLTVSLNDAEIVTHKVSADIGGTIGLLGKGDVQLRPDFKVTSLSDPKDFRQIPITGRAIPGTEKLDLLMLELMGQSRSYCASLAITRNTGPRRYQVMFHRTYGWLDAKKTQPAPLDAMIGTATAARFPFACVWTDFVRAHGRGRNISLFQACNALPDVRRFGPIADERIAKITINHMLTERTGWKGNPDQAVRRKARQQGWKMESPRDWMQALWSQPLQANPGSKAAAAHTTFHGWCEIVDIEAMTGKPVIEAMKQYSLRPLGEDAVELGPDPGKPWLLARKDFEYDPRIVANSRGRTVSSASALTLAKLMSTHFVDGRLRDNPGAGLVWAFGSLPNSTACLVWEDRFNHVILLNSRHDQLPHGIVETRVRSIFHRYVTGKRPQLVNGLYPGLQQQQKAAFEAAKRKRR